MDWAGANGGILALAAPHAGLPLAAAFLGGGGPWKQGCELVFMLALTDRESSLFYQI